jgi:hypothetical protein
VPDRLLLLALLGGAAFILIFPGAFAAAGTQVGEEAGKAAVQTGFGFIDGVFGELGAAKERFAYAAIDSITAEWKEAQAIALRSKGGEALTAGEIDVLKDAVIRANEQGEDLLASGFKKALALQGVIV